MSRGPDAVRSSVHGVPLGPRLPPPELPGSRPHSPALPRARLPSAQKAWPPRHEHAPLPPGRRAPPLPEKAVGGAAMRVNSGATTPRAGPAVQAAGAPTHPSSCSPRGPRSARAPGRWGWAAGAAARAGLARASSSSVGPSATPETPGEHGEWASERAAVGERARVGAACRGWGRRERPAPHPCRGFRPHPASARPEQQG